MAAITSNIPVLLEPSPLQQTQRTSTMDSRRSIFGSLKSKLSGNKQTNGVNNAYMSSHPQFKRVSAPTRRPVASHSNSSSNPPGYEAPPAYTAAPNAAPQPGPVGGNGSPVADEAYSFLDEFDTIFLIDDSGSMAGGLWRQTADALMTITPICTAHDADGVDIYFLNHPTEHKNVTSSTAVREIFQTVKPGGATPIARRMGTILKAYFTEYQSKPQTTKPINIICITDGVPTDDVEGQLIQAAKKLDRLEAPAWQVGVQFFQVGRDPEATKYLKELDDDLADIAHDKDLRDIVDTVPFLGREGTTLSGAGILKVVLGAVTRRLDRKSKELHR